MNVLRYRGKSTDIWYRRPFVTFRQRLHEKVVKYSSSRSTHGLRHSRWRGSSLYNVSLGAVRTEGSTNSTTSAKKEKHPARSSHKRIRSIIFNLKHEQYRTAIRVGTGRFGTTNYQKSSLKLSMRTKRSSVVTMKMATLLLRECAPVSWKINRYMVSPPFRDFSTASS